MTARWYLEFAIGNCLWNSMEHSYGYYGTIMVPGNRVGTWTLRLVIAYKDIMAFAIGIHDWQHVALGIYVW